MSQFKKRVLIIGGNSYIAKAFISKYREKFEYIVIKRDENLSSYMNIKEEIFKDIDVVVNTTAIVHKKNIDSKTYFNINYKLALFLAKKAAKNGVEHFIQLSTISVYGDAVTHINSIIKEIPSTPYGESKLKADKELLLLKSEHFTISIIRPPMVYGLEAPGNMQMLINLIATSLPLPLKNFTNKKSFIYIENLLNVISLLIDKKVNGVFLVKNEDDLSIGELSVLIKKSLNSKNILFPFPLWVLTILMKKIKILQKLYGTLSIDDSLTKERIGIYETVSTKESITNMLKKRDNK